MSTSTEPVSRDSTLPAGVQPRERTNDRRSACLADLVAEAAQNAPNAIALSSGADSMTYGEMVRLAKRLAAHLQNLGVGLETPVGLCLERSFDSIVTALAVLLAGGAYVPLDPTWQPARLHAVVEDAGVATLITRGAFASCVDGIAAQTIDLDRASGIIGQCEALGEPLAERAVVQRENLACVMYGFTSSGEPMGVELTHSNLLHLIFWHRNAFTVTARDRASHLAGAASDASPWEIWPYLTAGATLVLADEQSQTSADFLHGWLVNERITLAHVPTALAERLLGHAWPTGSALRNLFIRALQLHRAPAPGLPFTVVNNYGSAECSVVATSGVVAAGTLEAPALKDPPSIGKPIAHTKIRILDAEQRPIAPGQAGEIYISGPGVARGYRNRPQMTAQRFVQDPFSVKPGTRMFRTGDMGCQLPDGQIALRGRARHEMR